MENSFIEDINRDIELEKEKDDKLLFIVKQSQLDIKECLKQNTASLNTVAELLTKLYEKMSNN